MAKMKKTLAALPIFLVTMLVFAGIASAHVKIYPEKVTAGSYETFTVSVPSEKEKASTTKVKVVIPKNVVISRIEPRAGWDYQLKKDGTGKITAITWKATNGGLKPTEFIQLKMQGKVKKDTKKINFKAYQTYSDGSIVKWVGAEGSGHPAPVVHVSATGQMGGDGTSSLNLPLYFSIAALVLGIIAIITAAMRKKSA
ncbi:MAG TPA: YcnI family protein [Bacillales bacterium]